MVKCSGGGNTLENIQFNLFSLLNKFTLNNQSVEEIKATNRGVRRPDKSTN